MEIIPLAGIDFGRPIKHFASALIDTDLAAHAHDVLQNLGTIEKEVQTTPLEIAKPLERGIELTDLLLSPYT